MTLLRYVTAVTKLATIDFSPPDIRGSRYLRLTYIAEQPMTLKKGEKVALVLRRRLVTDKKIDVLLASSLGTAIANELSIAVTHLAMLEVQAHWGITLHKGDYIATVVASDNIQIEEVDASSSEQQDSSA